MEKYRISHEYDGFLIEKEFTDYIYLFDFYPIPLRKKYYPIDKTGFKIHKFEFILNRFPYLYTSIDEAKIQIDRWLKEKEYTYYPTV